MRNNMFGAENSRKVALRRRFRLRGVIYKETDR